MDASAEPDWGKTEEVRVALGQKFYINDYVAVLEEVKRLDQVPGLELTGEDVAVKARIRVEGEHDSYYAEPIFLIKDRSQVGRIPSEVSDLGIRVTLLNIHPDSNEFSLALNARQKDWVIIKALEKPYINVLWLGTGVLLVGFAMATRRRFREFGSR
jgi:cytochrome c-type biogenesis protein CcmF